MEGQRSKRTSLLVWTLLAALLSQNLLVPVMPTTSVEDQKHNYSPNPNAGTPPTGSQHSPPHGTPSHGSGAGHTPSSHGTPSHGGGGSYGGTPPSSCGNPPGEGHHNPTPAAPGGGGGGYYNPPTSGGSPPSTPTIFTPPSDPVTPPSGGGYYNPPTSGGSPPSTPTIFTPPSDPVTPPSGGGYYNPPTSGGSPPSTPTIFTPPSDPVTPPSGGGYYSPPTSGGTIYTPPSGGTIPAPPFDPNSRPFSGTCNFWGSHPGLVWGLLGWWGTMGGALGAGSGIPGFGANMSVQQALTNTRADGFGALYREGSASLLNSMVNKRFPFTTDQVRGSFVAALSSNKAAAAQAHLFKLANEGRIKPRD